MFPFFGQYNDAQFLFLGDWGPLWLSVFAGLALVVLALTWLDLRDMPKARRRWLLALRATVLAGGIFLVSEPAMELRDVSRIPNHIAVLVDDSASGQLPANAEMKRQEISRELVRNIRSDAHPNTHVFDFFRFGETLQPASQQELAQLDAQAPRTDILAAIDRLRERYAENTLGGVILISDGSDNATLASRVPQGSALDETSLQQLTRLRAPIHTVPIADSRTLRDIAIRRVRHDEFAFVRNAMTVEVDIEVHGYESGVVVAHLRRDGEILQSRSFSIQPDTQNYTLEFEFVPELIGKEVYSIDIPVERDDMVPENNQDFFVLRVIRDKIRVLQVVGRPTWDVRFFRQLMKEDPNVELVSFFILRDFSNLHRAPDNEMSLIPFPTHELFHEQLGSFDLVVLQNFNYAPFGMGQYLTNIRDYVKRGGGLLVLGGEGSFSSGSYARTPLEEVLPVHLIPSTDLATTTDNTHFRPVLTEAGERHPITRLEFDPRANKELWESLPHMHGTNLVLDAKENAIVLATHPTQRARRGPMPVLAVADQDEGRSMAMTVDSTWRWNYEWVLDGGSSRPYTAFWNSAIRWLIRDPALNLLQLNIGQNMVRTQALVDVQLQAFQADYTPAPERILDIQVYRRSLNDVVEGRAIETLHQSLEVTTDAQGRARFQVQTDGEAAWRVEAKTTIENELEAHAEDVFLSVEHSEELRDLEPRNDLLEAIAKATGGHHVRNTQALHQLPFEEPRLERVHRRKSLDVWSSPWILALFVALLGVEWQLRRRWGRL